MGSMIGNIVQSNTDITDEVLAINMLASAEGAAAAYLAATLTSTTPELRAMYSDNLDKMVCGHTALMELVIKRGWKKPYEPPMQQLCETLNKSKTVIDSED